MRNIEQALRKWTEFKFNLKKYINNSATKDLRKFVENTFDGIEPKIELYKGKDWVVFETHMTAGGQESVKLYFNPENDNIELTEEKVVTSGLEEKKRTLYSFRFDSTESCVDKKTVTNVYVPYADGYQVLIEGSDSFEKFNREGFQIKGIYETYDNPRFTFFSKMDAAKINMVVPSKKFSSFYTDLTLDFPFNVSEESFCVVTAGDYVSHSELDGILVLYDGPSTELSFPLFYDEDKNIIVKPFLNNPYLQLNNKNSYNELDISCLSFENHSRKDLGNYLTRRLALVQSIADSSTMLEKTTDVQKLAFKMKSENNE